MESPAFSIPWCRQAEEGVKKPNTRFHQNLLQRLGIVPAEAVFVNDNADNVAGATALGYVISRRRHRRTPR